LIEFSDNTIREANGYFDAISKLMEESGPAKTWMLRSKAFITTDFTAYTYILHLWNTGSIMIYETDKPLIMDAASDEDLRELSLWCQCKGWKQIEVSDRLLNSSGAVAYWTKAFIAGLVTSKLLEQNEQGVMDRLIKSVEGEEYVKKDE
jgi:hypothetical protein